MEIIPSVDIEGGICVKRIRGKPGTGIRIGEPRQIALRWASEGASRIHVVDLDGASIGRPTNFKVIADIVKTVKVPVQVGGGLRILEDFIRYIEAGVDRVVVGTVAYDKPELVEYLANVIGGRKIILALDSSGGMLKIRGWSAFTDVDILSYARRFDHMGLAGFLYTCIDLEGTLGGVDTHTVRMLVENLNTPIIYAGGVSSLTDLIELRDLGVSAVILGRALYEGTIDFKEALKLCV